MSVGQMFVLQMSDCQMSAGQMFVGQMSVSHMSDGQLGTTFSNLIFFFLFFFKTADQLPDPKESRDQF
jgi:hypothetical protein